MEKKTCIKCGFKLEASEFFSKYTKDGKDFYHDTCIVCLRTQRIRKKFRIRLEKFTNTMINELKKVSKFKFHKETEHLDFVIQYVFSIILYPMSEDGDQIFEESSEYFTGHYELYANLEKQLLEGKINWLLCSYVYYDIREEFIEWFAFCWEASGINVNFLASIRFHTVNNMCYDLRKMMWKDLHGKIHK